MLTTGLVMRATVARSLGADSNRAVHLTLRIRKERSYSGENNCASPAGDHTLVHTLADDVDTRKLRKS